MQNYVKKYLLGTGLFLLILFVLTTLNQTPHQEITRQAATIFNPASLPAETKPASGFAWNDNVGWINFGDNSSSPTGRVYISNDKLYGYAWGENIGWISLTCENDPTANCSGNRNYGVSQDPNKKGALTGYAWGENVGWIDFSPDGGGVNISTSTSGTNTLSGFAWGENIGWISFSGTAQDASSYGVNTTWTYPSYTLRYIAGANGTIIGSSTQVVKVGDHGTTVTALPNSHYHFISWSDGATTTTRTDLADSGNVSLTANFAINTFTFRYTAGVNGTITGSSTQVVNFGANGTTVTANPNSDYNFTSWSDGILTASRSDLNASSSLSVSASFVANGNTGGTAIPDCLYDNPIWSACSVTGSQSRTLTATNQTCTGDVSKVETQNCTPIIEISINPSATTTIFVGDKVQFTATVTGTTTNQVTWILPDEASGSLDNNGLYTAPQTGGVFHIMVRPQADISKSAIALVDVRLKPVCTDYVYSDWSTCINSIQTRIASSGIPVSCSGGVAEVLSKSCVMATSTATTTTTCTGYTYSDWSTCINSTQSRTVLTSLPDNSCVGGEKQITEQACIVKPVTVASDITVSPSTLSANDSFTVSSDGWQANSNVKVSLYSNPIVLGNLTANSNGEANGSFDMPKNLESGEHTVQLEGIGQNGLPRVMTTKITLTGSDTGPNGPTNRNVTNNRSAGGTSGILAILNIGNFVTDNVAVLGTTTERIVLGAQKVLESKPGDIAAKTITTAGVVGGGVAASSVFILNGTTVLDILFFPLKLWGLLLSALGLRKRNRPWGTVYDSVTKQPIDPAYVTLKKIGSQEETMSITDLDGRYGFLVSPGKYTLTANKTNYTFPSKKLLGRSADALYNNLYFGEELEAPVAGAVISKNIPLDPDKFDWNEFVKGQKKMMKFYSRREKIIRIATNWIFRIGFIVSLLSLFLVTAPYNFIIFGLYLLLTILRKFGLKQKALGYLTEKDGTPLSFAVIRIFSPELDIEITNKVADKIGRYYCLVPKGKYLLKVEKKNDDESYSVVYTSPIIDASNGIINRNFIV